MSCCNHEQGMLRLEVPGRCSVPTNSTVDLLGQYAKLGFRVPRWISGFVLFAEVFRRGIPERYPLRWAMRWMGGEALRRS